MYTVKTPWWLPKVAPSKLIWKMPAGDPPAVYLTFDDGPHPIATPFVLDQLAAGGAQGTFFCIGKCVAEFPELFSRIISAGHSVGNHTFNHLNGWKTSSDEYLENIALANELIPGRAFRPPYGKISRTQAAFLHAGEHPWKVYMWTVLSADFDVSIAPEKCLANVLSNITPGAIVVFHDSAKAWDRLRYALPFVIDYCNEKGWAMEPLPVV